MMVIWFISSICVKTKLVDIFCAKTKLCKKVENKKWWKSLIFGEINPQIHHFITFFELFHPNLHLFIISIMPPVNLRPTRLLPLWTPRTHWTRRWSIQMGIFNENGKTWIFHQNWLSFIYSSVWWLIFLHFLFFFYIFHHFDIWWKVSQKSKYE